MGSVIPCALITLCLLTYASSFPSGAPPAACEKLAPKHMNTTAQTSASPYTITINSDKWSTKGMLTVNISGDIVNGFILQARQASNGVGIGMFDGSQLPSSTQPGPCVLNGQSISVTHTDPKDKMDLQFVWMAPDTSSYSGEIYFQGAVARNHSVYWTDIKSVGIAGKDIVPPTSTMIFPTTTDSGSTSVFAAVGLLLCSAVSLLFFSHQY